MDKNYNYLEEFEDFLGGTFHQDISSPEQVLDEFISEVSRACLVSTINDCEEFLNNHLTKEEKEEFIQSNTEVYFPAIEVTPLQWLYTLVEQMREGLKTK